MNCRTNSTNSCHRPYSLEPRGIGKQQRLQGHPLDGDTIFSREGIVEVAGASGEEEMGAVPGGGAGQ